MKTTKMLIPFLLIAATPSSAFADRPTVDQIPRCNMPVPAPLSWMVAYIPCWAFDRI